MKLVKISEENLRTLENLQEVIPVEEEKNYSYDELLKRILKFYRNKINF